MDDLPRNPAVVADPLSTDFIGNDDAFLLPHSRNHHGNDYAASLVPIQLPSTSIAEVKWEAARVSIFFSSRAPVVIDNIVFDVLPERPHGLVAHTSSDGVLMATDMDINCLPSETITMWPKTQRSLNVSYGSQDPRAQTMFDGHFLTPVAHEYVNHLPGMSRWRGFLALAGVVVWAYYAHGTRYLHFQSGSQACETDPLAVCGARISLSSRPTAMTFEMPWTGPVPELCSFSPIPTAQYMELEYGSPVVLRSVWPVFVNDGVRFIRVPPTPFRVVLATCSVECSGFGLPPVGGYSVEWEDVHLLSLTPSLYGYSTATGCQDVIRASTPRGKVMPSLILQGLGVSMLPSVPLSVTHLVQFEALEPGRFGVVLSDSARRFPVPYGVNITGDPRYSFRRLKQFKAVVKYVKTMEYQWQDQRPYDSVNLIQQPIGWFFQAYPHEGEMFKQWYREFGAKYYVAVACEYRISQEVGSGDVLLRNRETGDYVCLEVKGASKGVVAQAQKFAASTFQRFVYAGFSVKVFPATLVNLTFTLFPAVTLEKLHVYNIFTPLPKTDEVDYVPPWTGISEDVDD